MRNDSNETRRVSREARLVSQEGGNLHLSGTVVLDLNILNVLGHFVYVASNPNGVLFFRHGEKSAGVIAAVLNNSNCGVGLAYKAHIGGMSQATVNNTSIYAKT